MAVRQFCCGAPYCTRGGWGRGTANWPPGPTPWGMITVIIWPVFGARTMSCRPGPWPAGTNTGKVPAGMAIWTGRCGTGGGGAWYCCGCWYAGGAGGGATEPAGLRRTTLLFSLWMLTCSAPVGGGCWILADRAAAPNLTSKGIPGNRTTAFGFDRTAASSIEAVALS